MKITELSPDQKRQKAAEAIEVRVTAPIWHNGLELETRAVVYVPDFIHSLDACWTLVRTLNDNDMLDFVRELAGEPTVDGPTYTGYVNIATAHPEQILDVFLLTRYRAWGADNLTEQEWMALKPSSCEQ